jgi:hypothetical protein
LNLRALTPETFLSWLPNLQKITTNMRNDLRYRYLFLALVLFFLGCATTAVHERVADFERPAQYARFFEVLDRSVDAADGRNAASFAVAGFPYLRTNRFLTGLKQDLDTDARQKQWIRWLQRLDIEARKKEIRNLPSAAIRELARELGETPDRQIIEDRVADYSEKLLNHDQGRPDFFATVQAAVTNPDEYRTAYRVVGIYPITSLPVAYFTHRVQEKFKKWHHTPVGQLDIQGEVIAYGPSQPTAYSQAGAGMILKRSRRNALGVPIPSVTDAKILVNMFAPVIHQDQVQSYDRIGAVVWKDGHVRVNPRRPTVYYYLSQARFKGEPVLQLNYAFWYSARDGPNSPWIERGTLDGVTVRISLANDGLPFMVDIMNTCGCYHFYVPDQNRVKRIIPTPGEVDVFVPRWIPELFPRERLTVRINSGWHQVVHLGSETESSGFLPYRLVDYDRLEMLPHSENHYESIFNSRGIAKDSERIEFLIFFPMGIPDVGSMRQRGHHAVKLVGRSDFEDPDLFDDNFEYK